MCSAVKSALFVFSFCSSEPLLFQVHTCAAFAQVALWMLILTNSRSMEYVVSGERERRRGSSAIAFTASLSGLNKAHNCVFVLCSIPRLCWIKKKDELCVPKKKKACLLYMCTNIRASFIHHSLFPSRFFFFCRLLHKRHDVKSHSILCRVCCFVFSHPIRPHPCSSSLPQEDSTAVPITVFSVHRRATVIHIGNLFSPR